MLPSLTSPSDQEPDVKSSLIDRLMIICENIEHYEVNANQKYNKWCKARTKKTSLRTIDSASTITTVSTIFNIYWTFLYAYR